MFRILLGFLPQTAGEARVLGRDSQRLTPQDRARIGFVNEEHTLPGWMRVSAVKEMHRHQYPRWNEAAFESVLGHYHVLPEQKVGQLSRGERAGFLRDALGPGREPAIVELLQHDEGAGGVSREARRPQAPGPSRSARNDLSAARHVGAILPEVPIAQSARAWRNVTRC